MFSFFNKKISIADSGLLSNSVDRHTHILPGIDDGFKKLSDSLEALTKMQELGVKEVWLTPHVMTDYPNQPAQLKEKFEELRAAYTGNIRLHLAAEHMLDTLFIERFEADNLMPMDNNILLIETSYFNPPMEFDGIMGDILNSKYTPLLAHPERYKYMNTDQYRQLKEKGVLFQLNLGSLVGGYGKTTQEAARKILANGWYDCIGSDIHSLKHLQQIHHTPTLSKKEISVLKNIIDYI